MDEPQVLSDVEELECFICPITYDVMKDPVISPYSGQSFERESLEGWVKQHHSDPLAPGSVLELHQLIPNRNLKSAIEIWKKLDATWKHKAEELKSMRMETEQFESRQNLLDSKISYLERKFNCQVRQSNLTRRNDPTGIPEYLQKHDLVKDAFDNIKSENYEASIRKFKSLSELFPNNDWINYNIALSYAKCGDRKASMEDYKESVAYCKTAIQCNSDYGPAYRHWGRVLFKLNRLQESDEDRKQLKADELALYQKALTIDPNDPKTHTCLGMYYQWENHHIEAREAYKKAVELDPTSVKALLKLGEIYFIHGKKEDTNPESKLKDFIEAEKWFQEAIKTNPQDDLAHYKLGKLYSTWGLLCGERTQKGQNYFIQAIKSFEKSTLLNNKFCDAHVEWGFCLTKLGASYFPKAKEQYNKALQINPDDGKAKNNLAWIEKQELKNATNAINARNHRGGVFGSEQSRGRNQYNSQNYQRGFGKR